MTHYKTTNFLFTPSMTPQRMPREAVQELRNYLGLTIQGRTANNARAATDPIALGLQNLLENFKLSRIKVSCGPASRVLYLVSVDVEPIGDSLVISMYDSGVKSHFHEHLLIVNRYELQRLRIEPLSDNPNDFGRKDL